MNIIRIKFVPVTISPEIVTFPIEWSKDESGKLTLNVLPSSVPVPMILFVNYHQNQLMAESRCTFWSIIIRIEKEPLGNNSSTSIAAALNWSSVKLEEFTKQI